ncbi:NTP transferase domain-containing protein [Sediminicola sp. 1XM1-17]|uniref:NTP transferase domain-containing protein n=1 Tax=Sediminicola sp. 1XM1-17 TaxID=3127702 RepID=UPI0030779D91
MSKEIIYGLVLSGGKSMRMGTDKGAIVYHELPQREHLYHMLEEVCDKTFLSIRSEQVNEMPKGIHYILDNNEHRGPYNGILSAHKKYPNVAWLVLACDLPLMDLKGVKQLIAERNPKKVATAFAGKENRLPEPLCAIWEIEGLKQSITHLINGTSTCPRKFLINSDVHLVFPAEEQILLNANSKEEYEEAILKLT